MELAFVHPDSLDRIAKSVRKFTDAMNLGFQPLFLKFYTIHTDAYIVPTHHLTNPPPPPHTPTHPTHTHTHTHTHTIEHMVGRPCHREGEPVTEDPVNEALE